MAAKSLNFAFRPHTLYLISRAIKMDTSNANIAIIFIVAKAMNNGTTPPPEDCHDKFLC